MSTNPVTLDFSKAQPLNQSADMVSQPQTAQPPNSGGVTLDFSKSQPISSPQQPQGPSMGPQPKSSDFDDSLFQPKDPFERIKYRMAAPFARKAMDAVDKLREVENFTQEGQAAHPVQAFMGHIANRLEGFLFGNEQHPEDAIGSGKSGMLTNPVTGSLLPGAEGTPAAASALEGGANLVKSGYQAVKGAVTGSKSFEGGASLIKQVMNGEKVAQEPAKAAIRSAVGAEEDAALMEKGHPSVMDEPLKAISEKQRAAYKAQDEAAGFDVKETRAKLKDAEWKVKQPEIDDATRERLTKSIADSKQSIGDAEKKMADAGVDPKAADKLFRQGKAGEEFKKAIVQHVSSDGESVNMDGLLNAAKKLRNTPKGDRLSQFLGGDEQADKFITDLQEAQKAGVHAMKVKRIVKWVGGLAGIGAIEETGRQLLR